MKGCSETQGGESRLRVLPSNLYFNFRQRGVFSTLAEYRPKFEQAMRTVFIGSPLNGELLEKNFAGQATNREIFKQYFMFD